MCRLVVVTVRNTNINDAFAILTFKKDVSFYARYTPNAFHPHLLPNMERSTRAKSKSTRLISDQTPVIALLSGEGASIADHPLARTGVSGS